MYCLNKHCAKSFCKKSFDQALWPLWRAHFYYSLHFTCCSCLEWHAYAWWRPAPPLVNAYAISLLCTELQCTPHICESCLNLFKMDWGVNIGRKLKTLAESSWAIWSIFWIEAGLVPLFRCTQQQLFTRMRCFFVFFFLVVMASGLWWTGNWNSGFSKRFLPARCFWGWLGGGSWPLQRLIRKALWPLQNGMLLTAFSTKPQKPGFIRTWHFFFVNPCMASNF